ncbi:hypothetical protein GJ496_009881 [Pomphorhynchus laevis]|nr:hypothetical protein GJ496_009881 [Pomphorhynchus laevis]
MNETLPYSTLVVRLREKARHCKFFNPEIVNEKQAMDCLLDFLIESKRSQKCSASDSERRRCHKKAISQFTVAVNMLTRFQ